MNDHFSIGFCLKSVPLALQLLSEFLIVVDFAVEDDPDRAIFIADGLVAGVQVNDCETAEPETYRSRDVVSLIIGSPMLNGIRHLLQQPRSYAGLSVEVKLSTNPAHIDLTLVSFWK